MRGLFVSATGTACGKTFVTRGLARAWSDLGHRVAALKPIETGVGPEGPLDALALLRASRAMTSEHTDFVRLPLPASPLAAARAASVPLPRGPVLAAAVRAMADGCDRVLVEGAGGLLVPLDDKLSIADLAVDLCLPLLLVGRDALGTLSHVLTAVESADRRALSVRAVVLTRGPWSEGDPSCRDNRDILASRLPCPVWTMPATHDDDDALALAVAPLLPLVD